jgi:hypothetical protein
MERGVGMASSNPLGGSNFRESIPIGIKSYPALALLSPRSILGLSCVSSPTDPSRAIIAASLTVLRKRFLTSCLEKTIVEAIELLNKILAGYGTVLIGG